MTESAAFLGRLRTITAARRTAAADPRMDLSGFDREIASLVEGRRDALMRHSEIAKPEAITRGSVEAFSAIAEAERRAMAEVKTADPERMARETIEWLKKMEAHEKKSAEFGERLLAAMERLGVA